MQLGLEPAEDKARPTSVASSEFDAYYFSSRHASLAPEDSYIQPEPAPTQEHQGRRERQRALMRKDVLGEQAAKVAEVEDDPSWEPPAHQGVVLVKDVGIFGGCKTRRPPGQTCHSNCQFVDRISIPQHVHDALPGMDWLGSEFTPLPLIDPRRTFLTSLVLASRFLLDRAFSNKAWAKLSGLEALEVGKCERALVKACNRLSFNCTSLLILDTPVRDPGSIDHSRAISHGQHDPNAHRADDHHLQPHTPGDEPLSLWTIEAIDASDSGDGRLLSTKFPRTRFGQSASSQPAQLDSPNPGYPSITPKAMANESGATTAQTRWPPVYFFHFFPMAQRRHLPTIAGSSSVRLGGQQSREAREGVSAMSNATITKDTPTKIPRSRRTSLNITGLGATQQAKAQAPSRDGSPSGQSSSTNEFGTMAAGDTPKPQYATTGATARSSVRVSPPQSTSRAPCQPNVGESPPSSSAMPSVMKESANPVSLSSLRKFSNNSTSALIRRFTSQMLTSLVLMHQHRIVHCNLKPENALLLHPAKSALKVIDFGSSCFEHGKDELPHGYRYVEPWAHSRHILAELYTGFPIFPGENEQEQLSCIMEVLGVPDKELINRSSRKRLFFETNGQPRPVVNSKSHRRRPGTKTLAQVLRCDDELFIDFISKCLIWDPEQQLKPQPALRHPFITTSRRPKIMSPAPTSTRHLFTPSSSTSAIGSIQTKPLATPQKSQIGAPTPLSSQIATHTLTTTMASVPQTPTSSHTNNLGTASARRYHFPASSSAYPSRTLAPSNGYTP
ncbi:hypothetical protein FRC06_001183 [Ceratobasidium sp. 370]|nr:hypothetical protein FRC06_001183 [Ceratobasidium sp. 370]